MKTFRHGVALLVSVATAALLAQTSSRAQARYEYVVIADLAATGGFHPPVLNDAGQVAWNWNGSVYRGQLPHSGAEIYVRSTTAPGANGQVSINNSGSVAFATLQVLSAGLTLVEDGAQPRRIATFSSTWPSLQAHPSLNDAGAIAFRHVPGGASGSADLWLWSPAGGFQKVAGIGSVIDGTTITSTYVPRLNDNGDMAFTGRWSTGAWHVYTSVGGVFTEHGLVSLQVQGFNNSADVAYHAGPAGILRGRAGSLRPIARPASPYTVLTSVAALNDGGLVAYEANLPGGVSGVFVGTPEETWPVLQPGDTIDGLGNVLSATTSNEGLNNDGQVSLLVKYQTAPGAPARHAIVRADPVNPDSDGDGVNDDEDAFPGDPAESVDTDGDGAGDNADTDDDGDGQSDEHETACGSDPALGASRSPDADGDGLPDCVDDGRAPEITVPASFAVEATSAAGAVVSYQATASDDEDPNPSVSCSPASGSAFPIGVTVVACSASDASGNTATASFTVAVRDTTAPVLVLPDALSIDAASFLPEPIVYSVGASDVVGPVAVGCTPSSGSGHLPGAVTVSCTASDAAGNLATGSFVVTIVSIEDQLERIARRIETTLTLPRGVITSLTVKLRMAAGLFRQNRERNRPVTQNASGCHLLFAYEHEVHGIKTKLAPGDMQWMLMTPMSLIRSLNCWGQLAPGR